MPRTEIALAVIDADEPVVWRHRPSPWPLLLYGLFPRVFILCWAGIIFFFFVASIIAQEHGAMIGLGIFSLFGALALWSVFDDFWRDWRTEYILTSRRLLVRCGDAAEVYGPQVFAQTKLKKRSIEFNFGPWGSRGRACYGAALHDLRDPGAVLSLITKTLCPVPQSAAERLEPVNA